jgi:hypothetical protein
MCLVAVHPWQDKGVGVAPFRFVTLVSLPSPSIAERNPSGYENAMRDACEQGRAFGVGFGSCHVCGMALMNNCVIRGADGRHFVVGIDCCRKTNDSQLVTSAEAAERARQIALKNAERDRKWQEQVERNNALLQAQRDRNGGLTDSEIQQQARNAERDAKRSECTAANRWLVSVLECEGCGDFICSMIEKLETNHVRDLSDRCVSILRDIYAKSHGRRGSKKYDAAYDVFNVNAGIEEHDDE